MLWAIDDRDRKSSARDRDADAEVVPNTELVLEPAGTWKLLARLAVVTRHDVTLRGGDRVEAAADRPIELLVQFAAVVWDVLVGLAAYAPRTRLALCYGVLHRRAP
jgi:hypothetical protein